MKQLYQFSCPGYTQDGFFGVKRILCTPVDVEQGTLSADTAFCPGGCKGVGETFSEAIPQCVDPVFDSAPPMAGRIRQTPGTGAYGIVSIEC